MATAQDVHLDACAPEQHWDASIYSYTIEL